ncbi:hypothetical protein DS742_18185 [Lacrimispora amygdalina]|uniref:Uncharacterized protein n=1 Tax=Lacrimispora amygdalina TaxID=253257 RepID=A0A3E2N901_9FIRM|nr:hypothetical protein [Clostridium indicum]RFZ77483.1 hypothetical protein DS742_18185 [Clostridium indicum]
MNNRTMVRISLEQESVSLRTYSRQFRSPQRFVILRKELEQLIEKKWLLTNDIRSFAELRLKKAPSGNEVIVIRFSWLTDGGADNLKGHTETVYLPFTRFHDYLAEGETIGQEWKILSIKEDWTPRIEFRSRRNLREVIARPLLRHKLGLFLSRNLRWVDYERFVVTDDFVPYSFGFTGYTPNGPGVCGGIILHGQENLKKAEYSLHT